MHEFLGDGNEVIPILFDTDIGSDIDDAVALAYLLKQPRCDLLGITTVTGDVQQRAALAEMICRAAGRDVPIHCGARSVLLSGAGQPRVPQYEAVKDLPHRMDRPEFTAVEFMLDTIRSRKGEIILLTVGPMTNLALMLSLDPTIVDHLRGIVSMAGEFFSAPYCEWNVSCDPVASAISYNARRKNHISVGLDVTMKVTMSKPEVKAKFTGPILSVVERMAQAWFTGTDLITFHDPLAAAIIFHPGLCSYQKGTVRADVEPSRTHFVPGAGDDVVAEKVDVPGFFTEYFEVLTT
ncbi:nucleoside hydrolase IunH [soil metagenome]